jgi:hypothetical protein
MEKLPRLLGAALFASALFALLVLLVTDAWDHFHYTSIHRRAGAWSFLLVGLSYIALQFRSRQTVGESIKKALLGLGFALWGVESFLPAGILACAVDTAVIVIFVVDLGLVILQRLTQRFPGRLRETS